MLPIILDIYIEKDGGGDDHYVERHWNLVPEVGDVVVHFDDTDGNPSVICEGEVKRRLFCTGSDGALRVQLHCTETSLVSPAKEPETAADTL